jgi:hypothetical protein
MWDLWAKSDADSREKWPDVADVLENVRSETRRDGVAECLQLVFMVGAVSGNAANGTRGEAALNSLLPETTAKSFLEQNKGVRVSTRGYRNGGEKSLYDSRQAVRATK